MRPVYPVNKKYTERLREIIAKIDMEDTGTVPSQDWVDVLTWAAGELDRLRIMNHVFAEGLQQVEDLIDQSTGVAGLHLNGDVAEWDSLQPPGEFGVWLDKYDAAIMEVKANYVKGK